MSKKEKYLIEKSNTLNGMQATNMSLTELRFFLMYISRINARNMDDRTVLIDIKDFENLFNVSFNSSRFTEKIAQIMGRTVTIYEENDKVVLTLYSEFRWEKNNAKILEITCNDKMLPYLFQLKANYTTYIIENIAKLNSVQKIRLYEIMKQYEKMKFIDIELKKLQQMMDCEITNFSYFNRDTLKPAIKDINEYTDIMVSYEKILSCRKVVALKFTITKKDVLKNIIDVPNKSQNTDTLLNDTQSQNSGGNDKVMVLYYELDKAYSTDELEQLLDICKGISSKPDVYLKNIYYQIRARKKKINNLFSYTLTVINAELRKAPPEEPRKEKSSSYDDNLSYDLNNYIRGLNHKYREEPFPSTQKYYFHSNEVTTFDIHTILKKNFDIYDDNLYDIRSLQGIIDYIYKKYNVLLIDVNPTGEYDKLAFGER